jgi:DNA-binding HxlR family transcriptional regulator
MSFNKWNKVIYDKWIIDILDNSLNSQELFENFRKKLLCISNKMLKQENMSLSCN